MIRTLTTDAASARPIPRQQNVAECQDSAIVEYRPSHPGASAGAVSAHGEAVGQGQANQLDRAPRDEENAGQFAATDSQQRRAGALDGEILNDPDMVVGRTGVEQDRPPVQAGVESDGGACRGLRIIVGTIDAQGLNASLSMRHAQPKSYGAQSVTRALG